MSQTKKKPVQYFFVDINDPDYYKRIKVARACTDCRKRKSKCDIGIPGSGACSSCRKHNKTCEFTATTATILSSSVQTMDSSLRASSSLSAQPYIKRKKIQGTVITSEKISPSSFQAEADFHWPPQQLTIMVPEGASYYKPQPNNTTTTDASQFMVTQEDNHLVGHLRFDLPIRFEQQQQVKSMSIVPLIPMAPPLLLSPPPQSTALSSISSSSSTTSTPSSPLDINHACDATYPWKASKSGDDYAKKENLIRLVSHVDPVKSDYGLISSSYLQQQQQQKTPPPPTSSSSSSSPSEIDLLNNYFERIHPSYPALSKNILKLRQSIPSCLRYAIMGLSMLDYQQQHQQIPTNTLARDYYSKAWAMIQSRGTSDLVSAQTLLLLYKYHETIGQVKPSLLESTRAILEQQQKQQMGGDDEWICRLCWLVYLHQFNTPSDTANITWDGPPMIRLPCLLPSEKDDPDQAKTISQFLDSIHIACVYVSAMQNIVLPIDGDPWSSSSSNTFGPPRPDDNIDSSMV